MPLAIATVFGVGYIPFAPGTFGSAAGLVLWWLLPALSVVLVIFGVSDVLIGITSDPGITVAIIGLTPTELETVTTEGYRLADFMVRTQGLALAAFGLVLSAVLLVPYRAAQRWAWYAAFILPAFAILAPLTYLVFGLAPGAQPSPPMISGPVFAAISVLLLVADRPRFARRMEATSWTDG